MKKFTLLLSAMLLACATSLWAESKTITYTVASTSSVTTTDTAPEGSSATFKNTYTNNKEQLTANYSMTLTLKGYDGYVIKGITLNMKSNKSAGAGTFSAKAGSTTLAEIASATNFNSWFDNTSYTTTYTDVHVTMSNDTYVIQENEDVVIKIAATTNSLYCSSFTITYELSSTPVPTLKTLTVSGTPDKTNYDEGETFDPTGLVVTGTYSDGNSKPITNGIKWTFDPEVLATTTEDVKVVATVGTISSAEYVVPVTVTEHVVTPGTYSINLNAGLYDVSTGNNETEQTVTTNDITITSGCTSSATTKTSYQTDHIRYYADSYLKLAVPTGYDITKIVFTAFDTDNWKGSITVSAGTYNNDAKTWTGVANSVDFSFAAQNRVKTIAVTYEVHQDISVATPVLTAEDGKVAGGEFVGAFELTMVCETENATIFYTLDESDPKTSETAQTYTAAITISETTTVRAIAKAGEDWSREATETYTYAVLTTMDEIFATATEAGKSNTITKYIAFNDWIVTGVKGSNVYLTDGTKGLIIYTSSHGFVAGDMLSGTVSCDITLYNGSAEIKGLKVSTTGLTVTKEGTAPVQTPAIKDLSPINTGSIISLSNLTYNGSVLTDADGNAITPFNAFITLPTMTSGKKYNVKGVFINFGETKEIAPLAESDIQEVTTPSAIESAAVEMPAIKTIENGQLVILRDGVKYNAMGVRLQ